MKLVSCPNCSCLRRKSEPGPFNSFQSKPRELQQSIARVGRNSDSQTFHAAQYASTLLRPTRAQ
jgi:hypothetical protein